MRQFARKKPETIPAVPPDAEPANNPRVNPISLKRLFHGGLREVAPQQERCDELDLGLRRIASSDLPTARRNLEKPDSSQYKRYDLTLQDVLNVNRATVREGEAHRFWPAEVVLKFLAADVVTRKVK